MTAGEASASAPLVVADGRGSLTGAFIIPEPGQPMDGAIAEFVEFTGAPLYARKHDYGADIPERLQESDSWTDRGTGRKTLVVFRPGAGWVPGRLALFLGLCKAAGLVVDVTLHPEAHHKMHAEQYRVLCEIYVPVIHQYGFTHTFCVSNFAAITTDALERFWPGDEYADSVAVTFYPTGLSLDRAAAFADEHGKPFGLAEFTPDFDRLCERDNMSFLDYTQDFFARRIADGKPCGDLVWLSGCRDGDFRIMRNPVFAAAFRKMTETLVT